MTNQAARPGGLGRVRWLPVALVAAAALAACGSGGSASSGGQGGGAKVKDITFWLSASDAQAVGYKTIATNFEAKTGVKVQVVNVPYDGFQDKLRQAAQANSLPDTASVPALDPLWTNQLQDLTSTATNASNKIIKSLYVPTADGKVLTIPSDVTAAGLFINKSLFDKAKVSYPTDPAKTWTWDDFLAAATKVRLATGAKYDLVYDHSAARIKAFYYQHGAKGFQLGADGKYSADPATVPALQKFASLNDDKIMPKSVWTSDADPNALFKSGQVVAYVSGVWQVADFADSITNFEWASVPTPAQPVQATDVNTGGNVVAFKNGDRADVAKQFIDFMFQPDNYTKLAAENGYLPVETGLTLNYPFKKQAALDAYALYNKEIEIADPISASGNQTTIKLITKGKAVMTDPTKDEMTKLVNGEQDAQKTVANIVASYNQQIA